MVGFWTTRAEVAEARGECVAAVARRHEEESAARQQQLMILQQNTTGISREYLVNIQVLNDQLAAMRHAEAQSHETHAREMEALQRARRIDEESTIVCDASAKKIAPPIVSSITP